MFGQGQPQKTRPICFCGDKSHHWWHSVVSGKQLGSISHRSVTGRRGQLHTFKTAEYEKCVWVCVRACVQVCILCEDWLWSRGYHGAELEAICCLLQSCWTTVSYVNWPFVQCAKWNQHIREMRGARSPLGPRTARTDGQNGSLLLTE